MKRLKTLFSFLFTRKVYHKVIAYGLLIFFMYLFKDLALLFFLTFIFAYLFYSLAVFLKENINKFLDKFCKRKKKLSFFKKIISVNIIIILEYLLFFGFLITVISVAIPKIQTELTGLSNTIPVLQDKIEEVKLMLGDINKNYAEIDSTLKTALNSDGFNYDVILQVFEKLKKAGAIIMQFIFSLILSLVFLLDRKKLKKYLFGIKQSNFCFLYEEYKIIFDKIIKSFGLILKAQSLIAFANASLTAIGLFIIGTIFLPGIGFPYLITLALVVFIFGFIPVLGVFLSSIPILIVGYSASGTILMMLVLILLIFIIHTIEAYYLNPKIVSNFLELPVSLTFVILIIGEHLFGIAGLLIGVSLFYFITELLKDLDKELSKKHKIKKIEKKVLKRVGNLKTKKTN